MGPFWGLQLTHMYTRTSYGHIVHIHIYRIEPVPTCSQPKTNTLRPQYPLENHPNQGFRVSDIYDPTSHSTWVVYLVSSATNTDMPTSYTCHLHTVSQHSYEPTRDNHRHPDLSIIPSAVSNTYVPTDPPSSRANTICPSAAEILSVHTIQCISRRPSSRGIWVAIHPAVGLGTLWAMDLVC